MIELVDQFQAKASLVGYLLQFRVALLHAVGAVGFTPSWKAAIEAADDIEELDSNGRKLLQIKSRADGTVLTDASTDLWKTIRIWATGLRAGTLDLNDTKLLLLTTAEVSKNSIAASLLSDKRDEASAVTLLDSVANSSSNKDNSKAYTAWKSLDSSQKLDLVSHIECVPSSPDLSAVGARLRHDLRLAVREEHLESFLESLEGWWFRRCIETLTSGTTGFITALEVDAYMTGLRERFLPGNLPVDDDIFMMSSDADGFGNRLFVKQAELAAIGGPRISSAVRDYLRAFTQRSRWARQGLVSPDELNKYEQTLREEWKYIFDRLDDELPTPASEDEKMAVAKNLYAWVEDALASPIRPNCNEAFLVRGSLHILADRLEVGWHPDFEARLVAILEPAK